MKLTAFSKALHSYYMNELAGINLTRITEFEDFHNKQILDSLLPLECAAEYKKKIEKTKLVLDVGFGGGFPILPLSHYFPEFKFIGIDARKKKCESVNRIINHFQLRLTETFHHRLENILIDCPVVITFKAVGKVIELLDLINCTNGTECYAYFYKGPNVFELENKKQFPKEWKLIEEKFYHLPGTEGRYLLGFKKIREINTINRKVSVKELVKLSDMVKNLST